jgi:hypothetical protein
VKIDLHAELVGLVSDLQAAGIAYALCGALALAVHGVPRATKDIDLLVRGEALDAVRAVARGRGFIFEALPMTFAASRITVHRFTKLVEGRPLMLDALLADETLAPVFASRIRVPWEGLELQVVSRDGLVALKTMAGRPQDLVDLQRLFELDPEDRG